MSTRYFVYMYIDPRNGLPFYIGKGTKTRYLDHLRETKRYIKFGKLPQHRNMKKINKIKKILSLGLEPIITKVYFTDDPLEALTKEQELIESIGVDKLTNILIGGPDTSVGNNPNYGNKWSIEQKEHLSKTRKEMFKKGSLTPPTLGIKRDDLSKRNSSRTKKVYKIDLEGNVITEYSSAKKAFNDNNIPKATFFSNIHEKGLPLDSFFYRYEPQVVDINSLIITRNNMNNNQRSIKGVVKKDVDGNIVESFSSIKKAYDSIKHLGQSYDSLWKHIKNGNEYQGYYWEYS